MEKKSIAQLSKETNILIVDDDKGVRDFLTRFFKGKGYERISCVATGGEALEKIKKEKDIKLLLLDVRLPDINGIEVLRKIVEINKDTEIIMITGFPDEAIAKQAMELGAYDYIVKPFDLAYLELCVFTKIITR
jgi:two-component system response regulator AtoC